MSYEQMKQAAIENLNKRYGKLSTRLFMKDCEKKFTINNIAEFRNNFVVVLTDNSLFAWSGDTRSFWNITHAAA